MVEACGVAELVQGNALKVDLGGAASRPTPSGVKLHVEFDGCPGAAGVLEPGASYREHCSALDAPADSIRTVGSPASAGAGTQRARPAALELEVRALLPPGARSRLERAHR